MTGPNEGVVLLWEFSSLWIVVNLLRHSHNIQAPPGIVQHKRAKEALGAELMQCETKSGQGRQRQPGVDVAFCVFGGGNKSLSPFVAVVEGNVAVCDNYCGGRSLYKWFSVWLLTTVQHRTSSLSNTARLFKSIKYCLESESIRAWGA